MINDNKIIRNSVFLGGSKIVAKLLTTIFTLAIARWSGNEQFGIYTSILTYISFFGIIEELGLTIPLIRKIAKHEFEPAKYINEVISLKILLSIPAFLSFFLFSLFFHLNTAVSVLFGLSMIIETLNVSFIRAFEGIERMERIAIITMLERLVFGGIGFIAVLFNGGLVMLAVAHESASVALLGMSIISWKKIQQQIAFVWDIKLFKNLLTESTPFAISSIFSVMYTRIDLALLTVYCSAASVGLYSASFRITEAMTFIPTAIVASIFPVLARMHKVRAGFEQNYGRFFFLLLIAGVILGLVLFIFSEQIVALLFGNRFEGSTVILQILSTMIPFSFLNAFVGTALISVDKEKLSTGAIILCAIVNTVTNAVLIPLYGPVGAAITKVGTEFVALAFQIIVMHISSPYKGLYTKWIAH